MLKVFLFHTQNYHHISNLSVEHAEMDKKQKISFLTETNKIYYARLCPRNTICTATKQGYYLNLRATI